MCVAVVCSACVAVVSGALLPVRVTDVCGVCVLPLCAVCVCVAVVRVAVVRVVVACGVRCAVCDMRCVARFVRAECFRCQHRTPSGWITCASSTLLHVLMFAACVHEHRLCSFLFDSKCDIPVLSN